MINKKLDNLFNSLEKTIKDLNNLILDVLHSNYIEILSMIGNKKRFV